MNKIITTKILKQVSIEQNFRKIMFKKGYKPTELEYKKLQEIDDTSTQLMKNVLKEIGLPVISIVGKKVSQAAWLLVQHSNDLEFQKEYLKLLKASGRSKINLQNIAFLEDKILFREHKPQIYGTQVQFDSSTKKWIPYKIKSLSEIDELRARIGLEPLEKYLQSFL